ncbi:MAG: ribosome small subunit-dependent GTPase A [Ignavibacteria bacterium GWA2_35_9]|nr:MAG: ribosome small subunit-dependent GTPase A [Ignavibacteria bacterium GWA2_35_9]OGU48292.1 MAG: ribosome small subunit-dependent GTPase A [Ignavibacteria bacterium GWB2_36_8]
MYNLIQLGWNEFFQNQFQMFKQQNFIPARIAVENKQRYILYSEAGELPGEVTGKLLYSSEVAELPKTGDWVAAILFEDEKKAIIHSVLERKSKLSRKIADRKTEEQVIAANVDYVFIVQSLDNNFNIRRLERYIVSTLESNIKPVIVLNKIDLTSESLLRKKEAMQRFSNLPVILTDALIGTGVNEIKNILSEGKTGVFAGSSGVGKSTIINSLMDKEILKTSEGSSSINKGKHTTTRRELLIIPDGGIVIDTPGMREFQLWNVDKGIDQVFDEIELLSLECKFSNCTHTKETGCAVLNALEKDIIDEAKMHSYNKLQKELRYLEEKQDKNAFLKRKEKEKKLHKEIKQINKNGKNKGI